MISEYFQIAIKNLRQRGLRSWLTMLGIFISIATIFTLVSLSLGLQLAVEEQFKLLGTDKFFIMPSTGTLGPPGSVGGTILTEKDVDYISKIRGIKDYSYMVFESAKIEYRDEIKYLSVIGMPLENMQIFKEMGEYGISSGQWLEKGDKYSILIGSMHKQGTVFDKKVDIRDSFTINSVDFKVKGIMKAVGNSQDDSGIFMPLNVFRQVFNVSKRVDYIMIQTESGEEVLEVAERTEKKLRNFRNQNEKTQDFTISTPEDLLDSFKQILNIITYFLAGVAAISLVVGAIGIANTMYTSVIERTKEIGIMKAIGAQNQDILSIFLIESGLLGLAGGIIGVILGFAISKSIELIAINMLNTDLLKAAAPAYLIFGCLGFGFFIGAISGILPALQASKTNVVDALRYE